MTAKFYQEWLLAWDEKLRQQKRHILLLQDNCPAHIKPDVLTNIRIENCKANLTAHVQPNDAGIIHCFKGHYRSKFISRAIDRYDSDVPPAQIYDINQLEAMRIADVAWQMLDATTISNCWRKAGILLETLLKYPNVGPGPSMPISALLNLDPIEAVACAEQDVIDSLNHLEQRGVLQRKNRMDIDELLNPAMEKQLVGEEVTEEDVFESVQQHRDARRQRPICTEVGGGACKLWKAHLSGG